MDTPGIPLVEAPRMTSTIPNSSRSTKTEDAIGSMSADRTESVTETRRVGVLSPHNSKETKAILNAIRSLEHDPVWIRDENVFSSIDDGAARISPTADVLINRMLLTKSIRKLEDLQLVAIYAESTPVVNPPWAVMNALHKFRASVQLVRANLPVPAAYFSRSSETFDNWSDYIPTLAAHKRTIGTNGRELAVISPDDPVAPRINNSQSFVQEFLETNTDRPSDIKVYVVGGEIVGAIRRYAPEGEWRTNVALGGEAEDVSDELDPEPLEYARKATRVLDLDVAGVDLMVEDGTWFILEVNPTAGFKGLFAATGISPAPYIARLAIDHVNGDVDTDRVDALSAELDDSVPDCKPSVPKATASSRVIGYTTRVRVSGRNGAEDVIAKSDTGAKRTSLDTTLGGWIGVGPVVGTTEVRSGITSETETRPLAEVDIHLNGAWRSVTVSLSDRSKMSYPVLLGRDVLGEYKLDVSLRVEE